MTTGGEWANLCNGQYTGYTEVWRYPGLVIGMWYWDETAKSDFMIPSFAVGRCPVHIGWDYTVPGPVLQPGKYYTFALCLEVSTTLFGSGGSTYADFCSTIQTWPWGMIGGYAESGFATPAALVRMSVAP